MSLTMDSGLATAWEVTVDDAPVALSARSDLVAVAGGPKERSASSTRPWAPSSAPSTCQAAH
ncbi:hypothetical protein ACF09Y_04060 [Streptomyces massasporeus]|uniref:hypothetical protein n=1 Tax=Streptomyces massasporeus TaxID=67324 RepID=UPI0036FA76CB